MPTCFKNPEQSSCIDLILKNGPCKFSSYTISIQDYSDSHKMILTVFKETFAQLKFREIKYRDCKAFNQSNFENELKQSLNILQITSYNEFKKTLLLILNKHASIKSEILRANNAPYMFKALCKAVMRRSSLKTKYLQMKSNDPLKSYKKHKNYCSRLHKKQKERLL